MAQTGLAFRWVYWQSLDWNVSFFLPISIPVSCDRIPFRLFPKKAIPEPCKFGWQLWFLGARFFSSDFANQKKNGPAIERAVARVAISFTIQATAAESGTFPASD
eukprot:Lithocolla_globosa_v1_NODE_7_length_11908_cov_272.203830.p8 type:complete len:105 gc:universal NODE_7_length_11908_cov_272.203830:2844-3158(+)